MMVLALLAPWVAPYDPIEQFRDIGLSTLGEPVSPNATFWLGTDGLGRDLTSRMLHGARISLGIAITANSISILLALLIGGLPVLPVARPTSSLCVLSISSLVCPPFY